MEAQVLAAIVGPLATATLAASGVALRGLRLKRQDAAGRARDLEVAGQTVAFIDAYLAAQQKLNPDNVIPAQVRDRATLDLEQAYTGMMHVAAADHNAPTGVAWGALLRRVMLRSVRRPAAKVVRAFYFVALFMGLLTSALAASVDGSTSKSGVTYGWGFALVMLVFTSVVSLLPALGLYAWARWLDRDRDPRPPAEQATLGSAVYWPPPTAPREIWPPPPGPSTQ